MGLNLPNRSAKSGQIIVEVETDLANRTLRVTYNPLHTASLNIVDAVLQLGFDANDRKGNAEARATLPESCR